jgi:hypothetical protein
MCGPTKAEFLLTLSPIANNLQLAAQEITSVICHLVQFKHLLCSLCTSVVPYKTLYHHLRHHHNICHAFCKAIVSQYENASVSQTDADVAPLPAGTPPLECLPSPEPGYFCPHCGYTTVNRDALLHHSRKTKCNREHKTRDSLSCFLERWVCVRKNVGRTWRMDTTTPITQRDTAIVLSCDQSVVDDPATVALLRMEAEEEARLLREQQKPMSLSNELEHDEKTDWLRGCGWPCWFAHKPPHLITATARLPPPSGEGVHLGTWNCMEWLHCASAETRLRRLLEAVALVLDRCEETLQQMPRVMRCWLRSWTSHFYAYPFELPQREATRARYRSYFNRFLCYVFRAWQATRRLMFDWWPTVDLGSFRDDFAKHQPGYSFLQDPTNQLHSSFRHLSRRAFSKDGGQFALKGKGREQAVLYLKQCSRLVKLLFSGIHTTSGMPARGEELRVLRWADTAAVQRNI